MRTIFVPRVRGALLRSCALLPISCLVGILIGCGAAPGSAPVTTTTPVTTTPTVKPKFAYTANQGGSISGYSIDPAMGALTPLSGFPLTVGLNPDNVTHDPQNRFLFVSDEAAEMLHVYALDPTTGALHEISPSPYNTMIESQMVVVDPSGTHVYLYRTGGSASYPGITGNQIVAFTLSSTGVLTPVTGSPFLAGAATDTFASSRGMAINATGKFLYLQTDFNLFTFSIDAASGGLTLLQTLPSYVIGGGIALDPGNRYLYSAEYNLLRAYAIDPASGLLSLAKSTTMATNHLTIQTVAYTLALSPDGNFAYTIENNNDLVSYAVNNGAFTPAGTILPGVYGLQIAVDPSGSFVYVPQACSNCPSGIYNVVHQFSITKTGALAPLATPTVASGVQPIGITVTGQ